MLDQAINAKKGVSGPPMALADYALKDPALRHRAERVYAGLRLPLPVFLPGESVTTLAVTLPKTRARQRQAMLTYAIEDRIAAPIDSVAVFEAPRKGAMGETIAVVVDRDLLDSLPQDQRVVPETALLPPPTEGRWSVWQNADRALVRVSDGTGFAIPMAAFDTIWRQAGRPAIDLLAGALPSDMAVTDLTASPPPPDSSDLRFHLRRNDADRSASWLQLGALALSAFVVAAIVHLILIALEWRSLERIALAELAAAEAAVSDRLPGVSLTAEVEPILQRLTPRAAPIRQATFLPLLRDVTLVLATDGRVATFGRLSWSDQSDTLTILIRGADLATLQGLEQALISAGFSIDSGAASAGDGGAEAEWRIQRAPS